MTGIAVALYLLGAVFAFLKVTRDQAGPGRGRRLQAALVALLWPLAAVWDGALEVRGFLIDRRPYWVRRRRWR
jgi:hypothetical protein